jgi:hypothetical protein
MAPVFQNGSVPIHRIWHPPPPPTHYTDTRKRETKKRYVHILARLADGKRDVGVIDDDEGAMSVAFLLTSFYGPVGCAIFATFFIRFEANLSEYWSYRFIFGCFGIFANTIYSHYSLHIRFKTFAKIRIQIFDLMQSKHIFSYWRIFASKYSFWRELRQSLREFNILENIRL